MEIDLTSVNSDLVNLIESQLLETELHVNNNEDIVMADDLLDLELDTMPLSQFTRHDTVSRVPYKKMHDSQTSNSQLSSELCCKDQTRSNNNSALLDATRSPDYDDMPPLELAWGDDTPPPASLPDILSKRHRWTTQTTEDQIRDHFGSDECTTCRLCQQHFSSHRRLRVHIPQHFVTTFCHCGEFSYHRDYILRHQRTMGCHVGHLYDVDRRSFHTFLNLIRPFITDLPRFERLKQGFPSPRLITHRPCPKPSKYKGPSSLPLHKPYPVPLLYHESSYRELKCPENGSLPPLFLHSLPRSDVGKHHLQDDTPPPLGTYEKLSSESMT